MEMTSSTLPSEDTLNSSLNYRFGRRFEIVSFPLVEGGRSLVYHPSINAVIQLVFSQDNSVANSGGMVH